MEQELKWNEIVKGIRCKIVLHLKNKQNKVYKIHNKKILSTFKEDQNSQSPQPRLQRGGIKELS